ncbi:hypothetical protein D3C76_1811150 [compost metagenome]
MRGADDLFMVFAEFFIGHIDRGAALIKAEEKEPILIEVAGVKVFGLRVFHINPNV